MGVPERAFRTDSALEHPKSDADLTCGATSDSKILLQPELQLAALLLQRGKPRDAAQLISEAHADDSLLGPLHPPLKLLLLQGQCLEALGKGGEAGALFAAAAEAHPGDVDVWLAIGRLEADRGNPASAVESLWKAHALNPDREDVVAQLSDALTNQGTAAKTVGHITQAVALYRSALEVNPRHAASYFNLGVVEDEAGRHCQALEHYRRAVSLQPHSYAALCNMGVIHRARGEHLAAMEAYEAAYRCAPGDAVVRASFSTALNDYGNTVKSGGDGEAALALYERALALNPRNVEAMYNLGVVAGDMGLYQRAVFVYEMAVVFQPQFAEAWNNLGSMHRVLCNDDRAGECYRQALAARPAFVQALSNLGVLHTSHGRAHEALQALRAAIGADPQYGPAHNNLGCLLRDVGSMFEAMHAYKSCEAIMGDAARTASQNRLLALNSVAGGEQRVVMEAHAAWGRRFQVLHPQMAPNPGHDTSCGRVLRVGYISPDLHTHSVAYFAEAPLRHHSASRVHHIVYSCVLHGDAKTKALMGAVQAAGGEWRDVAALTEEALAEAVRADGIDILVELAGHTANNRLGTMARKPAPVQVSWIGYPNTTGLPQVDVRLTDAVADPLDTKQQFTESLERLPGCFLCYTPAPDAPPVAPLPAASTGHVTFGCFNTMAKVTQEVLSLWAKLMARLPNSRLVLKAKPFACSATQRAFLHVFRKSGIQEWRIDLLPLQAAHTDHLQQYGLVDIQLDPFPYAGTTTTCESMLMGVPCITLAGACHAHNVGVSLNRCVGIDDRYVAHSKEEYLDKAVAAASDLRGLAALRGELRQRMLASPLCDAQGFVSRLEDTFEQLWESHTQTSR